MAETKQDGPARAAEESQENELLPLSFLHRLDRSRIIANRLYPGSKMGQRVSKAKGSGMEFAEHKQYSPGDDFRTIDWNVYARTDHLYLKTYETEMNLYVYILLDTSKSMAFGSGVAKLFFAKQLAAALGYLTLVHGDNLALHTMDQNLRAQLSHTTSRLRPRDVIRFCRDLTAGGETDLLRSFQAFSIHTGSPGMVFIISDFFSKTNLMDALRYLVYNGFAVFALHVIDPMEESLELGGEVDLIDHETGEVLSVTVRTGTLEKIRQSFQEHTRRVHNAVATYAASYFPVRTNVPVEKYFLEDFRNGGLIE